MTEQIEDDFWAAERARDTAARGRQADPSACGTCKASVAAGGQVKHDECAQRALLLPAPDAPAWELITGLSEEELAALPARFHVPAFVESSTPKAWVCAVCWGDGWSTQWPCKTAVEQGLRVFTAEDYAETRAKRQAAELAEHRAEATTPLVVSRFDTAMEAALEEEPGLTIGAIAENGRPVALVFDDEARIKVAGWLTPVVELEAQLAQARARITELEAERKRYVGVEPTIAEEMAYLGRCLDAVHQVCDDTVRQATRWENPLPVPEWVEQVRTAADGEWTADIPRPALPWAHTMDDGDLHLFLDDLVSAAMGRWRSDPDIPDRQVLADVEKACADWRTPGQGLRSDEPGAEAGR